MKKSVRVLLINPDYWDNIFKKSKARTVLSRTTLALGLAVVAAPMIERGYDIKLLDLNSSKGDPASNLREMLRIHKPHYVGITMTTPMFDQVRQITDIVKEFDSNIKVVSGGPHPTVMPEDVLEKSKIDFLVLGEGDFTFLKIIETENIKELEGIAFCENGNIKVVKHRGFLKDLDNLPMPALYLFDTSKYHQTRLVARKNPTAYMETSRGCPFGCVFCNKSIFGHKYRFKSPQRVVDEIEFILKLGFKEIHIIDDNFTANRDRTIEICEEILKRGLKFPWYPRGGLRVDMVDYELLKIMRKAGCYRTPFGIESGSDMILKLIHKNINRDMAIKAVNVAKKAGMETECYFMLGLPKETEEHIKQSIEFAKKLDPDWIKFAIHIPLPGTRIWREMKEKGLILSQNWSAYNFAETPKDIYKHETLDWKIIEHYYSKAHRDFYFRLNFIIKRLWKSTKNRTILHEIKSFFQSDWF